MDYIEIECPECGRDIKWYMGELPKPGKHHYYDCVKCGLQVQIYRYDSGSVAFNWVRELEQK